MKRKLAAAVAACAALIFAAGCASDGAGTKPYYFYGVMNAYAALFISDYFDGEKRQRADGLAAETRKTLNSIESSLSVNLSSSSIKKFNDAAAGAEVEIDKTAYEVLSLATEIYNLTDGYYNPAVYYCVQAYGFDGSFNFPETEEELPKAEDIEKFVELSEKFGEIALDEREGKYYALKPEAVEGLALKIDLGGIGKGYAADKINELISESGFEYGYFNLAQSSIAFKKFIKGDNNYTLQLTNPRTRGNTYMNIPVSGVCVSTSGDYEQYYEIGGVRYCHIINPKTGAPVQTGIMSATVICESAARADALSTAIMAMGRDAAVEFISTLRDCQVIFTCDKKASDAAYGIYTNIPASGYKITSKSFSLSQYIQTAAGVNYVA